MSHRAGATPGSRGPGSVTGARGRRLRARDIGRLGIELDHDQVALLLPAARREFIERTGMIALTHN